MAFQVKMRGGYGEVQILWDVSISTWSGAS